MKIDSVTANPAPPGQLLIVQGQGLDAAYKLLGGDRPALFKINSTRSGAGIGSRQSTVEGAIISMTSADKIKSSVDAAIDKAEPLVDRILEKAESLTQEASDRADLLVEKVKEKAEPLLEKVKAKTEPLFEKGGDGSGEDSAS